MSIEEALHANETPGEPSPERPAEEEVAQDIDPEGALEKELAEFEEMIGDVLDGMVQHEIDSVISVPVVEVRGEDVLVDMGDKAEGVAPIEEFQDSTGKVRVAPGERIEVLVLGRDEETGLIEVSHRQARAQSAWQRLVKAREEGLPISGVVSRVVKSGLLVDIGIEVFMPASQVSDKRVRDLEEWVGRDVEVALLDLDPRRKRAVVSRRKLIEEARREAQLEILGKLNVGDMVEGTARSVLDFGAFLDIGGLDAFLPREEVSWDRGAMPAKTIKKGSKYEVKILHIDLETHRIKVSRKAALPDPWDSAAERFPVGEQVRGEVVSITRFGAFVHIEEGLTGLIHVSDLSWSKERVRVDEHLKEGDQVSAAVLSLDVGKRRLSLGLKQLLEDPWVEAERQFPKGSKVQGVVTGLTNFGAFVKITDEIEGLIHISDISWDKKLKHPGEVLKKGQEVEAVVLRTDASTRRFSLGAKQLTDSPMTAFLREHPVKSEVEGEVVRMIPTGAFVNLAPSIDGFLHVSQIDQERVEKPEDVLKIGEMVRCRITKIEKSSGKIALSRKQLLQHEEREAIKMYKARPSDKGGVNLGELLKNVDIKPSDAE